ncbi:MAG: pyrroline-5-carboxylate reductase [Nitrospiraceae bacterium]|nr:MAG: pyrroline-5-carboxylate reductase [Nitrospiraceae bacterium]
MLKGKTLAFLGGGNMSDALIAGLLQAGTARTEQIIATDILPDRRDHLKSRYRIKTTGDNREAAGLANILILSVEPQVLDEVLEEIQPVVQADCLILSVAAGYPIARVASHLKAATRIVRAMPNTPSTVREAVTALTFPHGLPEDDRNTARTVFESVGKVVVVEERLMDADTGLSGSGPAYVYVMIEALADGGVKMGLPRQVAELLAAQTVLGAARMLIESGDPPGRLKDRVASPGGTTIAGLYQLEKGRLRAALISAVEAAAKRSAELGKEQGTV